MYGPLVPLVPSVDVRRRRLTTTGNKYINGVRRIFDASYTTIFMLYHNQHRRLDIERSFWHYFEFWISQQLRTQYA